MAKVKANGNNVWTFHEIVRSSDAFLGRNPHLRFRFDQWMKNQRNEGEYLIEGYISPSVVRSQAYIKLASCYRVAGKTLFYYAVAMDTYSFYAAENKSREAARIAGGWAGAWAVGSVGSSAGSVGGAKIAVVGGQLGPQAACFEELFTVPICSLTGAFIGGLGGSMLGYWGGSHAGRNYYDFINHELKRLKNERK